MQEMQTWGKYNLVWGKK